MTMTLILAVLLLLVIIAAAIVALPSQWKAKLRIGHGGARRRGPGLGVILGALWIGLLAAGTLRLSRPSASTVRAARALPAGTLLDTGDVLLGRGMTTLRRAVATNERIAPADLAEVDADLVPAQSVIALIRLALPGDARAIAAAHLGWLCPLKEAGQPIQVLAIACRGAKGSCVATVASGAEAAHALASSRSRGLFAHRCGSR